jgi:hypothetical protein
MRLCIVEDDGTVHEVTAQLEVYLDPSLWPDPEDVPTLEELLDDIKATAAFVREIAKRRDAS